MSHHWSDNVHTTVFTPRDYEVELLAAAREQNIIICLGHNSSKEFIALKLVHELGNQLRNKNDRKITLYIVSEGTGESAFNLIFHLTDLNVINLISINSNDIEWDTVFDEHQVFVLTPGKCLDALKCGYLDLNTVNLMVIEDCHKNYVESELNEIFKNKYLETLEKPKILGLAGPLHNAGCPLERLGAELEYLQKAFHSKAETASDIVTVLRYCSKPIEIILQCAPPASNELTDFLRDLVLTRQCFIRDHRFDPSEIYSDDFLEELQSIPDPKKEPLRFLDNFLEILEELGPWSADKASLLLLMQIEKCKVKTPYERHFLLLCLISTTFVQIRAHCDYIFQKIPKEKDRIEKYSTPKVKRLLEILKYFRPETSPHKNNQFDLFTKANQTITEINSLDFQKLNLNIESVKESVETNKPADFNSLKESLKFLSDIKDSVKSEYLTNLNESKSPAVTNTLSRGGFRRGRKRGNVTPRYTRTNFNHQNDPDALCGIIFCNSKFTAKILFNLLCEMTRSDPDYNYLNVQYTVNKVANPLIDAKEAEAEHRKQEEVLKKFRMHDCNLLIGTSVLEEGIDLPKCNLVVRWDAPVTYRSYVQCKGRSRALHAFHIIMVAPDLKRNLHNITAENLPNKSHKFICFPGELKSEDDSSTDGEESVSKYEENNYSSSSDDFFEFNSKIINKKKCVSLSEEMKEGDYVNTIFSSHLKQMETTTDEMVLRLAEFMEIEKMLLRNCDNIEPKETELSHAEKFTSCLLPYKPINNLIDGPSVNLGTAIALVNKYCAKLPSDTFTKLTPLWRCSKTNRNNTELFQCTLRLPINSPVKHDIVGFPMPTRILARRLTALIACKILHECGELDNSLQPIGKEGFRASEPDWEIFELEEIDDQIVNENSEPRPGTTKRRQYYYKRIASAFSHCRPTTETKAYLYHISMILTCPIPEEQNTRGRKIYPPEEANQGFGILTTKKIPKVSAFPIFTRSGEVRVSLELCKENIALTELQLTRIYTFINYTFTNVLRLQKYLMLFDPEATENSFYIVPTINTNNKIEVDWFFLDLITENLNMMPTIVPEENRKDKDFDPNKFKDAVVMPWYRNQDQPQYFYVAEICYYLSPSSSFPGENYKTFQEYYFKKYAIQIQNSKQPLLDVDHTSARLNFLTPRYVNRKGVALPTSSEETKKAKRENLEQKQILVPELCTIHPFPASLWRAAVCLPCILYRINALLLADEIRKKVSFDIGLGRIDVSKDNFKWPPLDFGWSLADVLKKSRELRLLLDEDEDDKEEQIIDCLDVTKKDFTEINDIQLFESAASHLSNDCEVKVKQSSVMEIGTWSNEMAESLTTDDGTNENEWNLLNKKKTQIRYGSPTSWDLDKKSKNVDNYFSDSDVDTDEDDDTNSNSSEEIDNKNGGLRIEFKSDNIAEAIETEEEILKRDRQLAILNDRNLNELKYQSTKNIGSGFNCFNEKEFVDLKLCIKRHENDFNEAIVKLKREIRQSGMLVRFDQKLDISNKKKSQKEINSIINDEILQEFIPFASKEDLKLLLEKNYIFGKITLENLFDLNDSYLKNHPDENFIVEGTGNIFDNFNENQFLSRNKNQEKVVKVDFNLNNLKNPVKASEELLPYKEDNRKTIFSFDYQPVLNGHPGPSPSVILQALTMSNANDGINLERLETIGDSFLKYAITTYLYCSYENVHEGKLSHLRSKQVSNLNLYRLGRKKILGESMIATKFEPHDNWLPPCYYVPRELEKALIEAKIPACHWNLAELPNLKKLCSEEICDLVKKRAESLGLLDDIDELHNKTSKSNTNPNGIINFDNFPCFIPYNLVTQHSIPDKSVADCVEALIGAYLIETGARGALLFMAWLGIRVLPVNCIPYKSSKERIPGSTEPFKKNGEEYQNVYGFWAAPKSPLLKHSPNPYETLEILLDGYSAFEVAIDYTFSDRSYLLQAMTHASYSPNRLTDCYQRLEFLGDAVLDYLITRHLYEDPRQHSPGALTDLRSALVNNTIFASLAVRHGFHKYFRHLSPGLNEVIDRFVRIQHENGHSISEEFYLLSEEECDEAEDVEVPKSLGDVFESVAGAIFLDSNMSLDTVWKVYSNMMKPEIELFSNSVPKSPIRELLELEPETAKFGKPEKLADGRRVRVTVEVFGKGTYRGIGRNYRIAKCTAAKCALRQLKKQGLISKKN